MCKLFVINQLNTNDVMRTSRDYGLVTKELITNTTLNFSFKID